MAGVFRVEPDAESAYHLEVEAFQNLVNERTQPEPAEQQQGAAKRFSSIERIRRKNKTEPSVVPAVGRGERNEVVDETNTKNREKDVGNVQNTAGLPHCDSDPVSAVRKRSNSARELKSVFVTEPSERTLALVDVDVKPFPPEPIFTKTSRKRDNESGTSGPKTPRKGCLESCRVLLKVLFVLLIIFLIIIILIGSGVLFMAKYRAEGGFTFQLAGFVLPSNTTSHP